MIDDYDLCTIGVVDPPHAAWSATADATVAVLRAAGVDPCYGSKLLGVLRSAGLVDVDAEGLVRPRLLPDLAPAIRPVLERMREPMIATGRVSAAEHAEAVAEFDNTGAPRSAFTPLMVSARGRKPWSPSEQGVRHGPRVRDSAVTTSSVARAPDDTDHRDA